MPVDVTSATGQGVDPGKIEQAAACVLGALQCDADELSVAIVDDRQIQELNREYRSRDAATDVLSFSQLEGEEESATAQGADAPPRELGDVVISFETALRQADEGGWSLEEEINRLLVHGVLHLLGHEHEQGGEPQRLMKAEEARIARELIGQGHGCANEDLS